MGRKRIGVWKEEKKKKKKEKQKRENGDQVVVGGVLGASGRMSRLFSILSYPIKRDSDQGSYGVLFRTTSASGNDIGAHFSPHRETDSPGDGTVRGL